jgi:hypothetical protein
MKNPQLGNLFAKQNIKLEIDQHIRRPDHQTHRTTTLQDYCASLFDGRTGTQLAVVGSSLVLFFYHLNSDLLGS